MRILVTGANGFVGKNLCATLKTIKDGKNKKHNLNIEEVLEYDITSAEDELNDYCRRADFVFNLAGVNRPKDETEFDEGNAQFVKKLVDTLESHKNFCPVMLSSSVQATLCGRFADSKYGISKLSGEKILFEYCERTGAKAFVFRFPNLFGKWCRPDYNSVVATFCHNKANGLPITVNDPETELELLYIDDLVEYMLKLLKGETYRCDYSGADLIACENGRFCFVPQTHKVRLGCIASLIESFESVPKTLAVPSLVQGSFEKKLYSTYLSYLPKDKAITPLRMNVDERGSFTEIFKTAERGQVSVNVSKPGVTKGMHWHHTKCEVFVVVSGEALIEMRKLGTDEVMSFSVSGKKSEAVYMLPGYTHSITNLSDKEDLVTLIWANESFDPENPDTFFEKVN